ncbi:MAG: acyl-CoA thioesterase [Candidatus Cloacimonetes bacterium]|nr:acyl-CoA thioesterase [Candidatus Cloacimonadota bacterium]
MSINNDEKIENQSILLFSVRYCETDQMGVANHARYFDWYSEGRVQWLKDLGLLYSDWERQGIVLPVVHLDAKYKQSAYFQQELKLITKMIKLTQKSIQFSYELYHEDCHIASATTSHLFLIDKKVCRVDDQIYQILKGTLQ